MPFNSLCLEALVEPPGDGVTVRIKRSDGLYYDPETKKFQEKKYFTNELSQLIPLIVGTGLDQWIARASIEINPSEFPDGDYSVYYHYSGYTTSRDNLPKMYDGMVITIFNGSTATQKVPSTTDIALRVLESRVGKETVRNTLLKIYNK